MHAELIASEVSGVQELRGFVPQLDGCSTVRGPGGALSLCLCAVLGALLEHEVRSLGFTPRGLLGCTVHTLA